MIMLQKNLIDFTSINRRFTDEKYKKKFIKTIAMYYKNSESMYLNDSQINNFNLVNLINAKVICNRKKVSIDNVTYDYSFLSKMFSKGYMLISDENSSHDFMTREDNVYFRILHDYIHFTNDLDFSFIGELNNYLKSLHKYTSDTHKILYSETIGQLAYFLYYDIFPVHQKVIDFTDIVDLYTLELK